MKAINRSLRQVHSQLGDATKKDDTLRLLGEAERASIIAKGLEPSTTPAEGREKYLKEFRRHQIRLVRLLLDLEMAVINDKGEEARQVMDKLAAYRDESHEEFKVEDDGDGKGWEGGKD